MMSPLATSTAVFAGANLLGFGISISTGWHYHLDLIGTGVFTISALLLRGTSRVQQLSAAAVSIWATKLASFLFFRALQVKRDARLETVLSSGSGAAGFWLLSFLWAFVVSLPHTLVAGVPAVAHPRVGVVSTAGLAMFALGLTLETAADGQKWLFKGDPANVGRFCDAGVWKLCQHPNWMGNLLIWSVSMLIPI